MDTSSPQDTTCPDPGPRDAEARQESAPARRIRLDPLQTVLFLAICAAAVFLYSRYGSEYNVESGSTSVFTWIRMQWRFDNFKFSWIMPVVALYTVWLQRDELAAAPKHVSAWGFAGVFLSLALHVLAYRAQQPRISLITFATLIWSTTWAVWGWEVARRLLFALGYTVLAFIGFHLMHFTMRLRLAASQLAVFLLNGIGIPSVAQGTVVLSKAGGGFQFEVADGCSGLRSLVVMTALAAPYAWFRLRGFFRRWALFLLSVPLAMLANTLRIFTIGMVAEWIGQDLAMKVYHDFSGYLVFFLAIFLLMATASLLEKDWKSKCASLLRRGTSRT